MVSDLGCRCPDRSGIGPGSSEGVSRRAATPLIWAPLRWSCPRCSNHHPAGRSPGDGSMLDVCSLRTVLSIHFTTWRHHQPGPPTLNQKRLLSSATGTPTRHLCKPWSEENTIKPAELATKTVLQNTYILHGTYYILQIL